VKASEQNID